MSRAGLKRAAHAFAVVCADHAVAIAVGISGGWPVGMPEITTRADLQIFDYQWPQFLHRSNAISYPRSSRLQVHTINPKILYLCLGGVFENRLLDIFFQSNLADL